MDRRTEINIGVYYVVSGRQFVGSKLWYETGSVDYYYYYCMLGYNVEITWITVF